MYSTFLFYSIHLLFVIPVESHGQEYSFPEIQEIFLKQRPQTGDPALRAACFGSIDDLVLGTYPPLHPGTRSFYVFMLRKALFEIKNEKVTQGATIWQMYNHGFVIKTPTVTFGIDIKQYFQAGLVRELPYLLDAYFISHEHGDHYSSNLINAMNDLGKPVVGPSEFPVAPVKMKAGDNRMIAGLSVTAHDGLHSVPVRQFEIITPDGFKFLHTGDNQTSETLPSVKDIDVMMLNSWINESGAVSWVKGVRIAIDKMKPKVTLPGHMMELGHLGSAHPPVPYRDPIASDNGSLASAYYILAWGERYHYDHSSNDIVPPNMVENLTCTLDDTLNISWKRPVPAKDGDTGSFYRIIVNDTQSFFTTEQEYKYPADGSEKYNVKVYSYDDCGNQSKACAEKKNIDPDKPAENRAVKLHSGGDYVTIPHTDNLAPKAITIECWIYLDGETGEQTILDKRDASGGYNLRIAGDHYPLAIAFVIKDEHESILVGPEMLHPSTWYHVAAVYDGNKSRLYLDGELIAVQIVRKDISPTRTDLRIGEFNGYPGASLVFHGMLDDLRLWDTARSLAEIKFSKNKFLSGDEPHLAGYWKFDTDEGRTIADTGPYQHHGILKGNARTVPSTAPVGMAAGIKNNNGSLPQNVSLCQNYPNPFNAETTIKYRLYNTSDVMIKVYNIYGQEIFNWANERKSAGVYQVQWNGKNNRGNDVASGLYFLQVSDGRDVLFGKMIFSK